MDPAFCYLPERCEPPAVKAITLHQPWASLVALGAKTIETRSWATSYRGPLAIHAGATRPPMMYLPPTQFTRDAAKRDAVDAHNRRVWFVVDTITDPAHQRPHRTDIRDRVPKRATTPTLFFPHAGPHEKRNPDNPEHTATLHLPLGAVVATCTLVACIPTEDVRFDGTDGAEWIILSSPGRESVHSQSGNEPLGDFTPGRYAWLLDNIEPIEPVPARGRQQLWEWAHGG